MKRIFVIFTLTSLLLSCNDGDIIVTSFDFDNSNLQSCVGPDGYVFFSINQDSQESISFRLNTSEQLFLESGVESYQIGTTTNVVDYRKYAEPINSSYFCNSVPPTGPDVTLSYSSSAGLATITTTAVLDDLDGLDIETEGELNDTDGDGLLDFYDFDDDGDNVPTGTELGTDPLNPRDTDNDGIPDYLDPDDDGDGILTRNEDHNMDLDPTNDVEQSENGPDYLNPLVANETIVNEYREHDYTLNSSIELIISDLVLVGEGEEITQETLNLGEILDIIVEIIVITPEF